MIKTIIKRDGREAYFNPEKIQVAIQKAAVHVPCDIPVENITNEVCARLEDFPSEQIAVETVQDIIEQVFMDFNLVELKNAYASYRAERSRVRDTKHELMGTVEKIGIITDRDNANIGNNFSSKLLRIASETNKWHNLSKIPKELAKLHEQGDLYYHDLDSYNLTVNCLHVDMEKVFDQGFNTGYGTIRNPKRLSSAAELSCIILQASQNDCFGGQSHVNFDNDLAPYVALSRKEVVKTYEAFKEHIENFDEFVEEKLLAVVHQAMQGIVYNLNTMHSRAGSQVPFSSLNIGIPHSKDAALICQVLLEEYEKGLGKNEQPIFPVRHVA